MAATNVCLYSTRCRPNGTYHYWPAVACCPLVSYVAYASLLQTTTDNDARERHYFGPFTLCVGGPVIMYAKS